MSLLRLRFAIHHFLHCNLLPVISTAPRLNLTGICPAARGAVVEELTHTYPSPVYVVIVDELRVAEQLAEDIAFFSHAAGANKSLEVLVFPESMPDNRDMREAFAASADRLTVLSRLRATRQLSDTRRTLPPKATPSASKPSGYTQGLVVVTTPDALLQPVPALEEFATRELVLRPGQVQSFNGLLEKL